MLKGTSRVYAGNWQEYSEQLGYDIVQADN